jgi:hypothetical protein
MTARSLLVNVADGARYGLSVFAAGFWLTFGGCAPLEPTPPPVPRLPQIVRPASPLTPVKGAEASLREALLFTEKLPAIGTELQIRTIVANPDTVSTLTADHETVWELRSGEVETVVDGTKQVRRLGELWVVSARARTEIRVLSQLAVLRAIHVVKTVR